MRTYVVLVSRSRATAPCRVAPSRVARSIDRSRYGDQGAPFYVLLRYVSLARAHACIYARTHARPHACMHDNEKERTRAADGKSHLNRACRRKKLLYSRSRVQLVCGRRMAPHRISSPRAPSSTNDLQSVNSDLNRFVSIPTDMCAHTHAFIYL